MTTLNLPEKGYYWKNPQGRKILISLILVFLGAVALDQVSKHHAQTSLLIWEDASDPDLFRGSKFPVGTIGNPDHLPGEDSFYMGLDFQYSRNRGAAFSMLADLPDHIRVPFFFAVTAIAVIMIALYLRSTPRDHHLTRLGLVFILSGAIGNFIDRLRLGYVIDFIDVDWNILGWQHDFAIFNIADVAINIGVILLLLDMLFKRSSALEKEPSMTGVNKDARSHF